jgi:CoA:oxalate CoA-transferase
MAHARPLEGLRVLDLSQGIAGPSCGGLFAEYGARVIKIEPPHGDWMRPLGPGAGGNSASFLYYNRGKESLAIDLKSEGAVDALLSIAAQSDVLIENNRPGVSERLGFGFETVRARQPNIVYVSVSGLGQSGPDIKQPLTDTVAQARSGLMSINTGRAGVPSKIDTTIIDALTGLYAFQAASMALWGDPARREARHLDISLIQSAAAIQGPKVMEFGLLGRMPEKLNAPAGSYPSSDGWFAISLVRETEWQTICRIIGREDLCQGRFATFADRASVTAELNDALDTVFKKKTTREWVELLGGEGILVSPINDYGEWINDAQTQATGGAPALNVTPDQTAPVVRTPGQVDHTLLSPRLGQHSWQILNEAGVTAERIAALIEAGSVRIPDTA